MRKQIFPNSTSQTTKTGPTPGNRPKRNRKDNYTDNNGNEGDLGVSEEEEYTENRGGVLRPEELKALADGVKNVQEFRSLGNGPLSPPKTASPDGHGQGADPDQDPSTAKIKDLIAYTPEETAALDAIAHKRHDLNARKAMLGDRDKLIAMVVARGKATAAELRYKDKSVKDICGYDARLVWSDYESNNWRASEEGRLALESGVLRASTSSSAAGAQAGPAAAEQMQVDSSALNGTKEGESAGDEVEIGPGVCKKKRCERHKAWVKLQQQDSAMEKEQVRLGLKGLDGEEKVWRERALVRVLEDKGVDGEGDGGEARGGGGVDGVGDGVSGGGGGGENGGRGGGDAENGIGNADAEAAAAMDAIPTREEATATNQQSSHEPRNPDEEDAMHLDRTESALLSEPTTDDVDGTGHEGSGKMDGLVASGTADGDGDGAVGAVAGEAGDVAEGEKGKDGAEGGDGADAIMADN